MISWWLHLTNRAIQSLDLLEGEPGILAAWSRRDRVEFYELATGTPLGEKIIIFSDVYDRESEAWPKFLADLKAPNGAYLPVVQSAQATLHATDDGRMHLYHLDALYLENDGKEVKLEVPGEVTFPAMALDRFLALIAALDQNLHLHVYQQHIRVGTFDIGLTPVKELRPMVAISRGGGSIFLTDGQQVILTDSSGEVRRRANMHYFIRRMACSPDGSYLITCDMDAGVIRIYNGETLELAYQRYAVDLVAEARQIQLLADLPPQFVAPTALAINDEGVIAFAMAGVICVTSLAHMNELPRTRALL